MSFDFGQLFKQALHDEQKVLRPLFFADAAASATLVAEESYLRLRLSRMFLKHRRELFRTKYPVVNALMRFAGLGGSVEVTFVARPELAGDTDESRLDDVVTLDQTILGPVLYRGGDLELMLGLYAAPADDWAQRFISLAEGVSQLTLNAALSTAVTLASTVKNAVESSLSGDGLDFKLGLDMELAAAKTLQPGYLVMISAEVDDVDSSQLQVVEGELRHADGRIYSDHDYLVLAIEVMERRSDWQALGYGRLWQDLLTTAADADDIETVKAAYQTFVGAIMASTDLSWQDRQAIVAMAQQRIKTIRDARASIDFFDELKAASGLLALEKLMEEPMEISAEVAPLASPFDTTWVE